MRIIIKTFLTLLLCLSGLARADDFFLCDRSYDVDYAFVIEVVE